MQLQKESDEKDAKIIDAKVDIGGALVTDVGPLDVLKEGIIGCYHNVKYKSSLAQAKHGFCILKEEDNGEDY